MRNIAIILLSSLFLVSPISAEDFKEYAKGAIPPPNFNKDKKADPVAAHPKFTAPKPPPPIKPSTAVPAPKKPIFTAPKVLPKEKPKTPPVYDHKANQLKTHAQSRKLFTQGEKPATSFKTPAGKKVEINSQDAHVRNLRQQLSYEKIQNRDLRESRFYGRYANRPVVVYRDGYNSLFWWWMLDQSLTQQALWAYHNRYTMDTARYNQLMSQNAELAAKVKVLESENTPRKSGYVPEGVDEDLAYSKQYVTAVYNPQSAPATDEPQKTGFSVLMLVVVAIFIVVLLACVIVMFLLARK